MQPRPDEPKKAIITVSENELDFDPKFTFLNLTNANNFGDMMVDVLKVFKLPIISIVEALFTNYLEFGINQAIKYIPNPFTYNDTVFDLSLIKSPQIIGDFLPIQIVGKFSPKGKILPFQNTADMPDFYKDGDSLQMLISEFTLKSLLYTLMDLGRFTTTIDQSPLPLILKFDTWYFSFFIPNIGKTYGYTRPVRLVIYAVENPPDINISPKYIQGNITFNLNIEVLTTKMIWDHAVVFKMQTDFIGYINIQNDLEVFIDIENMALKIIETVETHIGEVNISMFNTFVLLITKIIQYSVNLIFKNGIHIGKFLPIKIEFDKLNFKLQNHFMVLQATPKFQSPESIDDFLKFVTTQLDNPQVLGDFLMKSDQLKKILNKEILKVLKTHNIKEMLGQIGYGSLNPTIDNYKAFEHILGSSNSKNSEGER